MLMESISYFCLKDLYTALKEDKGDKPEEVKPCQMPSP